MLLGQDLRNFDYSPCCEMEVPVKNAVTFGHRLTVYATKEQQA